MSVKSVIRLYGQQTEEASKKRAMAACTVLLAKRIHEHNLKLDFQWFSRYFINERLLMDFAPAPMDVFLEYGDWAVFIQFKDSILTTLGACCNYPEIKQGIAMRRRERGRQAASIPPP